MKGTIEFKHDLKNDIIIATPNWNIETAEDCEVWFNQWAEYLKKFPVKEQPKAVNIDPPTTLKENMGMENDKSQKGMHKKPNKVWIKVGNDIHPVKIQAGINNDVDVEVISGLKDGDEIVVSMTADNGQITPKETAASSPFMPKMPSRNQKKK